MRVHVLRIAGEVQVEGIGVDGYLPSQARPPAEHVAAANLVADAPATLSQPGGGLRTRIRASVQETRPRPARRADH